MTGTFCRRPKTTLTQARRIAAAGLSAAAIGLTIVAGAPTYATADTNSSTTTKIAAAMVVPAGWRRSARSPYPSTLLEYRFGSTSRVSVAKDSLPTSQGLDAIVQANASALEAAGFSERRTQRRRRGGIELVELRLRLPESGRSLQQYYYSLEGALFVTTLVSNDGAPSTVTSMLDRLTDATISVVADVVIDPDAPESTAPNAGTAPAAAPTTAPAAPNPAPAAGPSAP